MLLLSKQIIAHYKCLHYIIIKNRPYTLPAGKKVLHISIIKY